MKVRVSLITPLLTLFSPSRTAHAPPSLSRGPCPSLSPLRHAPLPLPLPLPLRCRLHPLTPNTGAPPRRVRPRLLPRAGLRLLPPTPTRVLRWRRHSLQILHCVDNTVLVAGGADQCGGNAVAFSSSGVASCARRARPRWCPLILFLRQWAAEFRWSDDAAAVGRGWV